MIFTDSIQKREVSWISGIKALLFLLIISYSLYKLNQIENFFVSQATYLAKAIATEKGYFLFVALLLTVLNWSLEAKKWQVACNSLRQVSFKKSLHSVLTGQALNFIFPASIGHFVGRMATFENIETNKTKVSILVFTCQASQMTVTVTAGLIGAFYYKDSISYNFNPTSIVLVVGIVAIIAFFIIPKYYNKNSFLVKKLSVILNTITCYKILVLSFLRYFIFTAQYVLVLIFLNAESNIIQLTMSLSLVFLAKSCMPTFHFLSDLGVREFSALLFLPMIGLSNEIIISGSLYVWIINILLPSVTGAFLLFFIKWRMNL